jgi:protease IV
MEQPPPIPATPQSRPLNPAATCKRSPWGWIFGILFFGSIGLVLLAVLLVGGAIASGMSQAGQMTAGQRNVTETVIRKGGSEKIAHLDLEGIITGSASHRGSSMVEDFANLLDRAVEDPDVKAVVIRVNSPGGEVTASDRLHQMILKADARKPVITYMDTIAASGGYYAACGSRHLMAHPTTFTGSIGVIMQSVKYADLFEKVGVGMETYKSGEMKDLLSGSRETRPEEMALVNELISETYDRFLEIVAANRKIPIAELRGSSFTDGRIFSGLQGLKGGMIDSNGFIEDAYDKAAEIAGITGPTVVRYRPKPSIFDALGPFAGAAAGSKRLEIDISERLLPPMQAGVPLYLHPGTL